MNKILERFEDAAERREFMGDSHELSSAVIHLAEWMATAIDKLSTQDVNTLDEIGTTLFRERARAELSMRRNRSSANRRRGGMPHDDYGAINHSAAYTREEAAVPIKSYTRETHRG